MSGLHSYESSAHWLIVIVLQPWIGIVLGCRLASNTSRLSHSDATARKILFSNRHARGFGVSRRVRVRSPIGKTWKLLRYTAVRAVGDESQRVRTFEGDSPFDKIQLLIPLASPKLWIVQS